MDKVRLSLDVTRELNGAIDAIAADTGTTKSEVFRRALVLMKAAHEAQKDGLRVGFAREAGKLDREIIGL